MVRSKLEESPMKSSRDSVWKRMRKARWGYAFISPFYIMFSIFSLYPLLLSVYLSFTRWQGVGPMEFAGFVNYRLIPKDAVFWQSMKNGVILFFLYVPVMLFLALVLAVILNSGRIKGFRIFRTLIFLELGEWDLPKSKLPAFCKKPTKTGSPSREMQKSKTHFCLEFAF